MLATHGYGWGTDGSGLLATWGYGSSEVELGAPSDPGIRIAVAPRIDLVKLLRRETGILLARREIVAHLGRREIVAHLDRREIVAHLDRPPE